MAFRTWGRLLLTALGVSLLAGAGQLGIAFGFGIVRLDGSFTGGSVNQWPAQLVWAGWFAANAAVAGAVLTERLARRDGLLTGTARPVAVAAAAALGGTVVAPLCMRPARAAELISVDPVWAVAICATAGAVVGAGAATAVLLRPPAGWNMALVAAAVWLLALVSAAPDLLRSGPLSTVRLGVLEPSWLDPDAAQRLSILVLPLVALLAGAASGGLARWRGHPPLISGATGVAGPVMVAFAYLTASPGDAIDRYQATPYYGALIAVAVGALGSAAAALLRWPLVPSRATSTAIEPTEVLRALPAGPALPSTTASANTSSDGTASDTTASDITASDLTPATSPSATTLVAPFRDGPAPTAVGGQDRGTPHPPAARSAGPGATPPVHWDWPSATPAPAPTPAPTPAPAPAPAPKARRSRPAPENTASPEPTTTTELTATTESVDGTGTPGLLDPEEPLGSGTIPGAVSTVSAPPTTPRPAAVPTAGSTRTTTSGQDTEATPRPDEVPTTTTRTPDGSGPERTAPPDPTPSSDDARTADRTPTADATLNAGSVATGDDPEPTVGAPKTPPARSARSKRIAPVRDVSEAGAPAPLNPPPTPQAPPPTPPAPLNPLAPPIPATPLTATPPAPVPPLVGTPPTPLTDPAHRPAVSGNPEPPPRPRHRAPLPDLSRAATWDAFATARRAGTVGTPAGARPAGKPDAAGAVPPADTPGPVHEAGLPGSTGSAQDAGLPGVVGSDSADAAAASDGTAAGPSQGTDPEKPAGRTRGRRGLFRRKGRTEQGAAPAPEREGGHLPAKDEEFVDWVAGLSKPLPDNEPEQESGRRSLRSSGRHHRD
ncbi:hypothetical protein [Micromonospora endolithica]|uniref:Uncharacterized protein n=1 Tax=Micromonospora endolithica TaxID=230091 RepID=A0A3A9Z7C0_9ACTN|nr:hypothetical protein [Micromonospora endolithica]RKN44382.1 hypothetical protein D7223_19175 [Micromonospora endolithica]TWJ25870.1 branched-subunit amino acid ABC-type transport system permease component [Micromonospora endolithica]